MVTFYKSAAAISDVFEVPEKVPGKLETGGGRGGRSPGKGENGKRDFRGGGKGVKKQKNYMSLCNILQWKSGKRREPTKMGRVCMYFTPPPCPFPPPDRDKHLGESNPLGSFPNFSDSSFLLLCHHKNNSILLFCTHNPPPPPTPCTTILTGPEMETWLIVPNCIESSGCIY